MKSMVQSYVSYEEIPLPENYLQIELPNREVIIRPLIEQVTKQYQQMTGETVLTLEDQHLQILQLPDITSIAELEDYAMQLFKETQINQQFYSEVMTYLLAFYAETSQIVINDEEYTMFQTDYLDRFAHEAHQAGQSFEDYVKSHLQTDASPRQLVKEHAREEFIFKLVAQDRFKRQGYELTEVDYEAFVQQNVLHQGADEIDVREQFSFEQFQVAMPEMILTQELFDYFKPRFRFNATGASHE